MPRSSVYMAGIACGAMLSIFTTATASEEVRHVDAHIHGEGELNFAIEGSQLHLELSIPAHDILGFETISTEAQEQQLETALELLESDLWQPAAAAKCQLTEAHASASGFEQHDDHEEHNDHNDHDKHNDHHEHDHHDAHSGHDDHDSHSDHDEHDDHVAHNSHDDHDDHDEHSSHDDHDSHSNHHGHEEHASEGGHMDITASYVFQCGEIARLNKLSSSLFATFSRSEEIRVQGFTAKGQVSAEMSRSKPEVRF